MTRTLRHRLESNRRNSTPRHTGVLSGTEPLARVMVEGLDADRIREQAQTLADWIAAEMG